MIFALANTLGGSGFLAIYLAGMLVASRRTHVGEDVLRVSDGFAWLAQAGMFLVLGIITDARGLLGVALPALLVAAALMFVARPVAVAVCLLPFRFPAREIAFIGWIGMRGAVPIVLGLFPLLAGVPQAQQLFHVAFFIVLLSLLLQGSSLPLAARLASVIAWRPAAAIATAPLEGGAGAREVLQFVVADRAPATRRPLDELDWPDGARIIDIERDGRLVEASALRSGDLVAVVAPAAQVSTFEELFGPAAADGALTLDASATLGDLQDYYGVAVPEGRSRETTIGRHAEQVLRGRAATGDIIVLDGLSLRVRASSAGSVRSFSMQLTRRLDAAAAVDFQARAGDEVRLVRRQVDAGAGHVIRSRKASERDRCQELLPVLRRVRHPHELGHEPGRTDHGIDAVDADPVGSELGRHRLARDDDGALAAVVPGQSGPRPHAGGRCDVDEAAAAAQPEIRDHVDRGPVDRLSR